MDFNLFGGNRGSGGSGSWSGQQATIQQKNTPTTRFGVDDRGWEEIGDFVRSKLWWSERDQRFGYGPDRNNVDTNVPIEFVVENASRLSGQNDTRRQIQQRLQRYNRFHGGNFELQDYDSAMYGGSLTNPNASRGN